jgi:two-component system alkaline phosphatase synthesis response regulator PhoP
MRNKRILIVDDEQDILEFLSYNLKKEGYEVAVSLNGKDALSKAEQIAPDAIIADIRMPEMNGIEMCRQMRMTEALKDIPVLFLTADNDEYLALTAHHSGGTEYMNKPVQLNIISGMIKEMIHEEMDD